MKLFSAVSLFSNCGAGDVGYRRAGFKFCVMAELDPKRLRVSLDNHPGAVGVAGDLRKTWQKVVETYRKNSESKKLDLLCACPPCQGMSSARSGKGRHSDADAGSKDERNLLVTVIAKVAAELKPTLVVVENVQAFFNRKVWHPKTKKPVSAANLLIELLAPDYEVFPFLANLCDFGVPQTRKRAFLTFVKRKSDASERLSRSGSAPFPEPTHDGDGDRPKPITLNTALKAFNLPKLSGRTISTANADVFEGLHCVPVWSDRVYKMVSAIPKNTGRSAWENNRCERCGPVQVGARAARCPKCRLPLLRPVIEDEDGTVRLINGFKSSYRRMKGDRPAATITTASGHIGSDNSIHPFENRLLSPLECALLQTIPADYKWRPSIKELGFNAVREMIGEAVPPRFTHLHGLVLRSLLLKKWISAAVAIDNMRCQRAWSLLRAARVIPEQTHKSEHRV